MGIKSKNSKKTLEFDITTLTKGFISETVVDGNTIKEIFHFKQIRQIIHHPDRGVEIVEHNGGRRVFYNDLAGESLALYSAINTNMTNWMSSNLN